MTKLEKAIKELRWLQFNFPWQNNPENDADKMSNAIHKYAGDAIELLEDREPVKLVEQKGKWFKYLKCGNCHAQIPQNVRPNYCSNCGRAVKWNE